MVAIPEKPTYSPDQLLVMLTAWYNDQQQLAALKTREVLQRKTIAGIYFPEPVEGTNRHDIGSGFDLKLTQGFSRSVDEAALDASSAKMRKAKIKVDDLFVWKPSLVKAEYDALTEEQRLIVDECLTITESTPKLEIVPHAQDNSKYTQQFSDEGTHATKPKRGRKPKNEAAEPANEPTYTLEPTEKMIASGAPIEAYYGNGWTDDMLIEHGYIVRKAVESEPAAEAEAPKRGRKPKAQEEQPAGDVTYVPGPLMEGFTVQDFYSQGWTDEQLIENGYLLPQEPEGPEVSTPAPKKRGPKPGSKRKPK